MNVDVECVVTCRECPRAGGGEHCDATATFTEHVYRDERTWGAAFAFAVAVFWAARRVMKDARQAREDFKRFHDHERAMEIHGREVE